VLEPRSIPFHPKCRAGIRTYTDIAYGKSVVTDDCVKHARLEEHEARVISDERGRARRNDQEEAQPLHCLDRSSSRKLHSYLRNTQPHPEGNGEWDVGRDVEAGLDQPLPTPARKRGRGGCGSCRVGLLWAGLMFASAAVNAFVAANYDVVTWAWFMPVFGIVGKIIIFLISFAMMRSIGRRRLRAMPESERQRLTAAVA